MATKTAGQKIVDKGMGAVAEKARRLETLKIEYVPIDSIKPNSYNPNRQEEREFELLKRSITDDGFTQPIIVQRATNEIVDGEHRWRAGRALGMELVPVVYTDMTAEQMRISTLRHNRARGSEDVELGAQLLRDLRELGALDWAQDALMLDDNELQRLMDDVPAPEALAGEEYTEGWAPTKIAQGDARDTDQQRDSMSDEARKKTLELSDRMQKAETQEEKAKIEVQLRKSVYRINLIFKDDEAKIVRGILEPKPAQRLLALCHARRLQNVPQKTEAGR